MNISGRRLFKYLFALNRADFHYPYADGAAYHQGLESYTHALKERDHMLAEHPDDAEIINRFWVEFGGDAL